MQLTLLPANIFFKFTVRGSCWYPSTSETCRLRIPQLLNRCFREFFSWRGCTFFCTAHLFNSLSFILVSALRQIPFYSCKDAGGISSSEVMQYTVDLLWGYHAALNPLQFTLFRIVFRFPRVSVIADAGAKITWFQHHDLNTTFCLIEDKLCLHSLKYKKSLVRWGIWDTHQSLFCIN